MVRDLVNMSAENDASGARYGCRRHRLQQIENPLFSRKHILDTHDF